MEEKPMTGEEVIQQILSVLNGNGMQQAASGVYEMYTYMDSMTHKVEEMADEIASLREYIRKMEDDKLTNKLKKSLNEAADRLEERCNQIKDQIFEVKQGIRNKASEIMADFKKRGKEALYRVSEFVGLKDKLMKIRDKVKEGIADTNRTLSKLDAFGEGMREATQKIANTFRTFADKEEVDYSKKEQKFSKSELAKKPWKWQKSVYESMLLRLDGAIDKVENLARDIEIERAMDKAVETADRAEDAMQEGIPIFTVAEPLEKYQYGADAFEAAYPKMDIEKAMNGKTPVIKAPAIPNAGKVR